MLDRVWLKPDPTGGIFPSSADAVLAMALRNARRP